MNDEIKADAKPIIEELLRGKIAGYLGLAQKAGRIAAGDAAVKTALAAGKAELLVLAADIAPKVAEELLVLAAGRPVIWWPDKISLGLVVGKSRRGAVAVLDAGFASAIIRHIEKQREIAAKMKDLS